MKKLSLLISLLISLNLTARETQNFDEAWMFSLGEAKGAQAPDYQDSAWRQLNLPHDWAFEADYDKDAAQTDRGGYKPGGLAWYRKNFTVPSAWQGKRISIHFDGVFMNSEVWINGVFLGKRPYGYISFEYDLTAHLKPGKNTIALRAESTLEPAARWYHGCGIYAHVKLRAVDPVHIITDGVFVTTPEINKSKAEASVQTQVLNNSKRAVEALVETIILDPAGKKVANSKQKVRLAPGATSEIKQSLSVPQPKLWDTVNPYLYKALSKVSINGSKVFG